MGELEQQKARLLVLLLTLHAFALGVSNLRWSDAVAPLQKLVEPYLVPTAQQQPFRAMIGPSRIGFTLALKPKRRDGTSLPAVTGADLPYRERALLVDAARKSEPGLALDAAVLAVLPRLGLAERPARVEVELARATLPGAPFQAQKAHVVEVPP